MHLVTYYAFNYAEIISWGLGIVGSIGIVGIVARQYRY